MNNRPRASLTHVVQRPLSRRTTNGRPAVAPVFAVKPDYDWLKWDEFGVRLSGLHPSETTYNLWRIFRQYGEIAFIEIFEGSDGQREGKAKIKFSPPPKTPFWKSGRHVIDQEDIPAQQYIVHIEPVMCQQRGNQIQSPVKKHIWYEPKMKLYASAIHFGLMIKPTSMMSQHLVNPIETNDVAFVVNLQKNRIEATFTVRFQSQDHPADYDRDNKYMFWVPFNQLTSIKRVEIHSKAYGLVVSLDSPPQYFRKRQDGRAGHTNDNLQWNEFDTWYRQTDVVYNPYMLQTAKVALHKEQPVIDVGK